MVANIPNQFKTYALGCLIGVGSSSSVYQVYCTKTNEYYAAKFIPRELFSENNEYLRHVESELRILERIDHPRIAKFHEVIYLEDFIVIIMELLLNGTLHQLLSARHKLPEPMIYNIILQTAEALEYLHSKGISHRDIKPENIGFDHNMDVKLIDFGFGVQTKNTDLYLACGTPYFIAPEVIYNDTYDGCKADMWSLGITVYYTVFKKFPFPDCSTKKFLKYLGELKDFQAQCYGMMKTIIEGLLVKNPNERLTAKQVINLLQFKPDNNIRARSLSMPAVLSAKHVNNRNTKLIVRPKFNTMKSSNCI